MNIQETAAVLAKIKIGDNREVNELVIREWHDTISHLPYRDALDAVTMHRKSSTAYLLPAHLVENCRIIQRQRERTERVTAPRQIEPNVITLDRAKFEAETAYWAEFWRKERAGD